MPIVTLTWSGDVAHAPRGTRYELTEVSSLCEVRGYSPERPEGWLIATGLRRDDAMLAAQADCENLTAAVGAESDALAAGSRSQLSQTAR